MNLFFCHKTVEYLLSNLFFLFSGRFQWGFVLWPNYIQLSSANTAVPVSHVLHPVVEELSQKPSHVYSLTSGLHWACMCSAGPLFSSVVGWLCCHPPCLLSSPSADPFPFFLWVLEGRIAAKASQMGEERGWGSWTQPAMTLPGSREQNRTDLLHPPFNWAAPTSTLAGLRIHSSPNPPKPSR